MYRNLLKLLKHDFIAREQSSYLKRLKEELKDGEVIVMGDFAENCSVVVQNEIQSHYFSANQITIQPFVIYF